jgi:hypothetical protein
MADTSKVGAVIQAVREGKGRFPVVVRCLAGIGVTHLCAIERGVRPPTLEPFFKIAEALDMPASELMKRIENAHK